MRACRRLMLVLQVVGDQPHKRFDSKARSKQHTIRPDAGKCLKMRKESSVGRTCASSGTVRVRSSDFRYHLSLVVNHNEPDIAIMEKIAGSNLPRVS